MSTTQIRGSTQIQDATIPYSKFSDALIKADGTIPMAATLKMSNASPTAPAGNTNYIQCVTDPANAQDAATKNYVDTRLAAGTGSGATARGMSVGANLTLSGIQTIDGVAYVAGQTILVKDQTTPANNGLYTVASGAWTRSTQMNTWAQVPGMIISVEEGTTMHDTVWLSTADIGGTLGTTPITFVQLPGPSDIQAGAGLQRAGQVLNVVAADQSIMLTGSGGANNGTIAVKCDTTGASGGRAITTTANGIGVQTDTLSMVVASNALGVLLYSSGAILSGIGGIRCNPDGTTIQISANKLGLVPNLFLAASNVVIRETPAGTIDGSNAVFTLASTPSPANSELVWLNGMLQEPGAGNDYTISGNTITFLSAPASGSRIKANYFNRAAAPA